MTPPIKRVIY